MDKFLVWCDDSFSKNWQRDVFSKHYKEMQWKEFVIMRVPFSSHWRIITDAANPDFGLFALFSPPNLQRFLLFSHISHLRVLTASLYCLTCHRLMLLLCSVDSTIILFEFVKLYNQELIQSTGWMIQIFLCIWAFIEIHVLPYTLFPKYYFRKCKILSISASIIFVKRGKTIPFFCFFGVTDLLSVIPKRKCVPSQKTAISAISVKLILTYRL